MVGKNILFLEKGILFLKKSLTNYVFPPNIFGGNEMLFAGNKITFPYLGTA